MPATWKRIITTGDDSNYKNSNISSSDIPSSAITTAKIDDEAVTTKLNTGVLIPVT